MLADDDGVRATMTASWLLQMGWPEVYVLDDAAPTGALVSGVRRTGSWGTMVRNWTRSTWPHCRRGCAPARATVVDFATSLEYRAAHIPGAWFAVRSRLRDALERIGAAKRFVFTSPDGTLARLAALDAAGLTDAPLAVLAGGTQAWRVAGLPLEEGNTRLAAETDDVYYKPYDRQAQIELAMQDYLDWEVALVEQVKRESYLTFRG